MAKVYPNDSFKGNDRYEFEAMPTCCGCNECGNCCKALWCPCFRTAEIMTVIGMWSPSHPAHGNCSKNLHIWTGCCFVFHCMTLPLAPLLFLLGGEDGGAALGAIGGGLAVGCKCCFFYPIYWMRSEIGKQFNIPVCEGAGCLTDTCCPWYCWCWTMNQEYNTGKEMMNPSNMVEKAIKAGVKIVKAAL